VSFLPECLQIEAGSGRTRAGRRKAEGAEKNGDELGNLRLRASRDKRLSPPKAGPPSSPFLRAPGGQAGIIIIIF